MREEVFRLPPGFLQKIQTIYPKNYQQIVNTFLQKKATTFRINHLKTDIHHLRRALIEQRVRFKELEYPSGAFLCQTPLREVQTKPVYLDGWIYVQNVSSMLPVIVLEPQNGQEILDLCAAPGTKTTQMVSLSPAAKVTAIEKNRVRYYKLLANLKIQGCGANVYAHLIDGIWVRKKFPEKFDKILLDTPCSAEGRFDANNLRTYHYWNDRKVKEMVNTQKKLIYAAFFALKEGGEMVYSTCTFSPEENEEIIEYFLDKFSGKVELVPINIDLPGQVFEGLRGWRDHRFSEPIRLCRRIIPNDYLEGFFVAKLRKISV